MGKELFGNLKNLETKFGNIIKCGFPASDLQEMLNIANSNDGWCNCDILTSKNGSPYMKLNTFKATPGAGKCGHTKQSATDALNEANEEIEKLPF